MRLIDADEIDFNEVFKGVSDFAKDTREAAQGLIDEQPTIEAAPVVHGEWKFVRYSGMDDIYGCTICGFEMRHWGLGRFCPSCGAKMTK